MTCRVLCRVCEVMSKNKFTMFELFPAGRSLAMKAIAFSSDVFLFVCRSFHSLVTKPSRRRGVCVCVCMCYVVVMCRSCMGCV